MSYATEKPIAGIDTKIRISKNALVDLSDFGPEDVDLFSISRSLNNLKRFCGHYAYSPPLTVAQHTHLCTMIADVLYTGDLGVELMIMLHDMPEAIYGDLSSPLKRFLGDAYRDKIKTIDEVIYTTLWQGFALGQPYYDFIDQCKKCDHLSLRIEQKMLFDIEPPEDWVKEFINEYRVEAMFRKASDSDFDLKLKYHELVNHLKSSIKPI